MTDASVRPSLRLLQNIGVVEEIMARHTLSNLRVVGSVVRGEDREDSDIDFLVSGSSSAAWEAETEISLALGGIRVSILREEALYPPFRETILSDAVRLADYRPGAKPPRGRNFVVAKNLFRLRRILRWSARIRTILEAPWDVSSYGIAWESEGIESRVPMLDSELRKTFEPLSEALRDGVQIFLLEKGTNAPELLELIDRIDRISRDAIDVMSCPVPTRPRLRHGTGAGD
ncbi:MAG: nucleotidyltransferase family protein [Leptospirales bacterium]